MEMQEQGQWDMTDCVKRHTEYLQKQVTVRWRLNHHCTEMLQALEITDVMAPMMDTVADLLHEIKVCMSEDVSIIKQQTHQTGDGGDTPFQLTATQTPIIILASLCPPTCRTARG